MGYRSASESVTNSFSRLQCQLVACIILMFVFVDFCGTFSRSYVKYIIFVAVIAYKWAYITSQTHCPIWRCWCHVVEARLTNADSRRDVKSQSDAAEVVPRQTDEDAVENFDSGDDGIQQACDHRG